MKAIRLNKIIALALLGLCIGAMPNASAQPGLDRFHLLLAKEEHPNCVLANSQNIICYLPSVREMYHLKVGENSLSSRLFISLPAGKPFPPAPILNLEGDAGHAYLWDLSAQDDGEGNIVIAWRYSRDYIDSINVLRLGDNGQAEHHVVKEFNAHDSFDNLKTFVVDPHLVQFFYTNYSEQYFSPILDVGSIQKLWTLGWRDNKVVFDVQLSEKGKAHTERYDVSSREDGKFDVAWTERRIGSFLGPRPKLKIGTVSGDRGIPKLQVSAEVSIAQWEAGRKSVAPIIMPSPKEVLAALAALDFDFERKAQIYKKLDSNGKEQDEFRIDGDNVSEFGYDSTTRLFRYVQGSVTGAQRSFTKVELNWTDFRGRAWKERLEVPKGSFFPSQMATDCFYWLQPDRGNFVLRQHCRQPKSEIEAK